MNDEDRKLLFTQLVNKRRKLACLRDNMLKCHSQQPEVGGIAGALVDDELRDIYKDSIPGPSFCDEKIGEVDTQKYGSVCLDNSQEFSDYDSDDSVKDKTYEPHQDVSDDSYVSNSPDRDFVVARSIKKVKRKLFVSEELSQKQAEIVDNECLITLDDLLCHRENMSENPFFIGSPKTHDTCFSAVPSTCSSVNIDTESSVSGQASRNVTNHNDRIISYERSITSANNIDHLQNCNLTARDHTADVLSLSHLGDSGHIADAIMNEEILNTIGVMVVDINGTIFLPNGRPIRNSLDLQHIDESPLKSNTKKKNKQQSKWKRVATKIARLRGSPYHSTVAKKNPEIEGRKIKLPCSCHFKCYEKVPHETRQQVFNSFWKKCTSWDQRRQFIACNVTKKLKRLMKTNGNINTDRRKFSYEYRLIVNSKNEKVCRNIFLNTLSIGEKFVKVSLEKILDGGLVAPDKRGKHTPANKSLDVVIASVIDYINLYPCYESHYSRQKSGRKFLGHDLNICSMYKQYKEMMEVKGIPPNLVAKQWLYRNIFNTKFNLSFKLPSVDTCDDCDAYERKLLDAVDEELKKNIEKEKEVHAKAAEDRYNLKREDKKEAEANSGEKKVLMFDLQKCLATPNLTNSKSFYLRKLWTLNLTIFDSTANNAANILWSENIGGRGGNEIASCLIRWTEENTENLTKVRELTLWSDNCAGQNRNLMIVIAYMWILHKHSQLKIINHKFMLKGHTHMEVDQIHSQIERKKRKLKTMQIAIPRDWSQFIRTCGGKRTFNVYDMQLHDFKDITSLYKKSGPFVSRKKNRDGKDFKISECVWLQVQQDRPGILFYKNAFSEDFSEISLIRNGSKPIKFPVYLPSVRQTEKPISTAKYHDLLSLLQWIPEEFHTYYKNLKHCVNEADFPETE